MNRTFFLVVVFSSSGERAIKQKIPIYLDLDSTYFLMTDVYVSYTPPPRGKTYGMTMDNSPNRSTMYMQQHKKKPRKSTATLELNEDKAQVQRTDDKHDATTVSYTRKDHAQQKMK